ncbi:MAG: MFS transporter [Pseudomonadota bacterium]
MTPPSPQEAFVGHMTPFLRHRIAVSTMFFLNGMLVGGWAPAIPAFKDKHGLAESELGLMILLIGVGSLITMPITGIIIARFGSQNVLRVAATFAIFALPLVILAPTLSLAIAALLLFGGSLGSMDVSMNANAARVEARHDVPIMSSCHGFWSLGALVGAAAGGLLLGTYGLTAQALGIALVLTAGVGLAAPFIMSDRATAQTEHAKQKLRLPRSVTVYIIALITLAGFAAEGAILDWAALFVRDERGVSEGLAGYAFGAFSAMMAIVRFTGDPIRARFGDYRMMQVSSALAMAGFLIAGLSPTLAGTILGFAIVGLGLANIVPIGFAAADRIPGIPKGIGISIATSFGYAGLLVAPPLIGFVAEFTTFGTIFAGIALLPLYMLLVAGAVKVKDP